jgi:hypothetical protein
VRFASNWFDFTEGNRNLNFFIELPQALKLQLIVRTTTFFAQCFNASNVREQNDKVSSTHTREKNELGSINWKIPVLLKPHNERQESP